MEIERRKNEKEHIEKQYCIPFKNILIIEQKYGSVEKFIHKFKGREVYDEVIIDKETFVGFRGVTLSEKDRTVSQIKAYGDLNESLFRYNFSINHILDIDAMNEVISALTEDEQKVLNMRFGLDGEGEKTLKKIGESLGFSRERVRQNVDKILRKLRRTSNQRKFILDEEKEKEKLEMYNCEYRDIQNLIKDLNKIRSYIGDENGNPKGMINIDLSAYETLNELFWDGTSKEKTIIDLIKNSERKQLVSLLKTPIEELDFSARTCHSLKRGGINTLGELTQRTEEDLIKIRAMGRKSLEEILKKIEELGLNLGCIEQEELPIAENEDIEKIKETTIRPEDETENDKLEDKEQPKESEEVSLLKTPIEELDFSARTCHSLKRGGINTLGELTQRTEEDLIKIRAMGRKSLEEILKKIEELGLNLGCIKQEELPIAENEDIEKIKEATIRPEDETENDKLEEEQILRLIEFCDSKLRYYTDKGEAKKEEIDRILELIARCDEARRYYFDEEDIFDPNAIVPGVPRREKVLNNEDRTGRTGKEITQASISSLKDIQMADEEDEALKQAIEEAREGGIKLDEQQS